MESLRVLFIGNSHTYYNDMPAIFKGLVESSGEVKAEVSMQAHPGVTYEWHLKQGAELRYAFMHGAYDYVVMQQAAHSPCPSPESTIRDGTEIIRLAKLCGLKPIVTIPWAEKRFPEHQAIMYDTYNKLVQQTGAIGSPVGYVFERVLKERPDINLYWFDGEHCSPYGSYVNALSVYTMIRKKSPQGLPNHSFCSVGGKAEEYAAVKGEMDALREKTQGFNEVEMAKDENKKALAEVSAQYGKKFPAIWDKKAIPVDLDPEVCALLQQWVWEAAQKYL